MCEPSNAYRIMIRYDRKSRHQRMKKQEMARDVRGDYLDEIENFKWSGDSVKSLADWLASVNWLGFTKRQVWGVSLIRGLEMLKDGVPMEQGTKKPNTSKPISSSTFR